jgi:hypothetical protein
MADLQENDAIVGCKDLQRLRLFPFPCLLEQFNAIDKR